MKNLNYKQFFYNKYIKRFLDIIMGLIGLLLFSPLLLLLSLLIKMKLGSPIIFIQKRPGVDGVPFNLYKFRSMKNNEKDEKDYLSNEERLTTFGNKLRKFSLDELPTLINVIKGDMSIVGPRPLRLRYLPYFTQEQQIRFNIKPGITGYAQVNGRSNIDWDKKIEFDCFYVKNQSLYLDIKIIIRTLFQVVISKDVTPKETNFEIPFDEYMIKKNNNEK